MLSHTDLVEDMQTKTLTLQAILSLILHISLDNDDLFPHPCPKDVGYCAVAHGNLSLHSVGYINNLMILFFPSIFSTFLFSPFI